MRIVFLGSGAFAVPSLEALLDAGHDVAAVVTQPDRDKGRGRAVAPPPVKPVAAARGLRLLQPSRVKDPDSQEALRALRPEVQVVVAYGQILPRSVIQIAPRGTINVHASLLPRYRGAAPIQWAIASGEVETGVTTMLIDEGLDTGPILLARATAIGPDETTADLEPRLAGLGAGLLLETLRGLEDGQLHPVPQDHAQASLAPLLRKEDGRIDWARPAVEIANRVRGFHPWPGATASFAGRSLKVLRAWADSGGPRSESGSAASLPHRGGAASHPPVPPPGSIVSVDAEGIVVACGDGTALRLLQVQPESRRAMTAAAFAAGTRLRPGLRFD